MAIEWFWGGEGNSLREFDARSGAAIAAAKTGMSGSYCLDISDSSDYVAKNVTARADYYIGFRFQRALTSSFCIFAYFADPTVGHIAVRLNASYNLTVYRGSTLIATGTAVISDSITYRMEIYCLINDNPSVGRVIIKVDGVTDVDFTGDTQNGGTATITNIRHGYTGPTWYGYLYLDDIVYRTDNFPGDVRVGGKAVTANGATNDWDPSAGDNYACINDVDDTDYVSTNTPGAVDEYELANISEAIDVVQALKIVASARYQGAPNVTHLQLGGDSGGTGFVSGNKNLPVPFGVDLWNLWETDPTDSNAWTESKINGLKPRIKAVA